MHQLRQIKEVASHSTDLLHLDADYKNDQKYNHLVFSHLGHCVFMPVDLTGERVGVEGVWSLWPTAPCAR